MTDDPYITSNFSSGNQRIKKMKSKILFIIAASIFSLQVKGGRVQTVLRRTEDDLIGQRRSKSFLRPTMQSMRSQLIDGLSRSNFKEGIQTNSINKKRTVDRVEKISDQHVLGDKV